MNDIIPVIVAVLGSGGFTALITALIGANQRRKDRNDAISKKLTGIEQKLDAHISENEMQFVLQDRARIIAFADECARGVLHSNEAFTDVLMACDHYEDYCEKNKTFSNSKAEISIQMIKDVYKKCLKQNKFI